MINLRKVSWVIAIVLGFTACSSPVRQALLQFPAYGETQYTDPDGRKWVLKPDSPNDLKVVGRIFVPEGSDMKSWKEALSFGYTKTALLPEYQEAAQRGIREMDPDIIMSSQEIGDGVVLIMKSKLFNEQSVSKYLRVEGGWYYFTYTERLGEQGNDLFQKWVALIASQPMKKLIPSDEGWNAAVQDAAK